MAKFAELKEGDKVGELQFYIVTGKKGDQVQLKNDYTGGFVVVDQAYVESYLTSASEFTEERTIGKIEAANIFLSNARIPLTVNFNKQVDSKDAKEQMYLLYANKGGKVLSEADYKKKVNDVVKSIITGEERTMVGRHYGELNELGRVKFIDMEQPKDDKVSAEGKTYDSRLRQVDPRTINWMIIKGIKYTVKS